MSCPAIDPSAAYNMSMAGMFLNMLEIIISLERSDITDKANRVSNTPPENLFPSYDYIIIGAGAGG